MLFRSVGINEIGAESQVGNFYPNPASSITSVDYAFTNTAKSVTYLVTDITGKIVLSGEFAKSVSEGTGALNVTGLNNGVYNCSISNGTETCVRKLTVIR